MAKGRLEVFFGPMSSGKSRALVERLRFITPSQVVVFKPLIDTRPASDSIVSRDGVSRAAISVAKAAHFGDHVRKSHRVVGIDEVQFFEDDLVAAVRSLIDSGLTVAVAGLDTDFRGEPFEAVAKLIAISDRAEKFYATCVRCGAQAIRSQRLIGGAPAPYDAPRIQVGGDEMYEARCRDCHVVPRTAEKTAENPASS